MHLTDSTEAQVICMYIICCVAFSSLVTNCMQVSPTSMGGGSMKSKDKRSLMPIALRERTVSERFVRWISGTAVGNISSLYALSV